jgi:hypothetical protein
MKALAELRKDVLWSRKSSIELKKRAVVSGTSNAALIAIEVMAMMTLQAQNNNTPMIIFDRRVYFPPSGCGLRLPQLLQQHLQHLRAHKNNSQTISVIRPTTKQTTGMTTRPCTTEQGALSADGCAQDAMESFSRRRVRMPLPDTGLALKS